MRWLDAIPSSLLLGGATVCLLFSLCQFVRVLVEEYGKEKQRNRQANQSPRQHNQLVCLALHYLRRPYLLFSKPIIERCAGVMKKQRGKVKEFMKFLRRSSFQPFVNFLVLILRRAVICKRGSFLRCHKSPEDTQEGGGVN